MRTSNLTIRQLGPADSAAIGDLHDRLTGHHHAVRFVEPRPHDLDAVAEHIAADDDAHGAVGVFVDDQLAGIANYVDRGTSHTAEIALSVAPDHRLRTVGAELLDRLVWLARSRGISRFVADAVVENAPMMRHVQSVGWPVTPHTHDGLALVGIPID